MKTPSPEPLARAMSAHQAGRLEEADRLYQQAIQSDPGNARALRLRGVLARERGDLRASSRYLARAAEVAPAQPESLAELAITFMADGDLERAEAALRDTLQRAPGYTRAEANLGALLQYRGHINAAIRCHQRVLAEAPDDLEVRCNLAKALVDAGRGEEALAACDEALADDPAHPLLLATRGAVLCDLERFGEAVESLEQAVLRYPDDDMAFVNLAFASRRTGRPDRAMEALNAALRANPASGRAAADLVNLLSGSGQDTRALALATDFLASHPGERQVLAALGFALRDAGQDGRADELMDLQRLVHVEDIASPPGQGDLAAFNAGLRQCIEADASLLPAPQSKATRGGGQTGEFHFGREKALGGLCDLINEAVSRQREHLLAAGFGDHPVMAGASPSWTLRAWGTVLDSGGRQAAHIHPLGWLSGVYYVALPPGMDAAGGQAGWIEFGAAPERYPVKVTPPVRAIEPKPGRLLLFPSWFHHRTLPFVSSSGDAGRRISIAFDVIPRRG